MVAAVQAIHSAYSDPEYLRILQELMKLGIAPSGNKSIDKTKLEQAKAELIQKNSNKTGGRTKTEFAGSAFGSYQRYPKSTAGRTKTRSNNYCRVKQTLFWIIKRALIFRALLVISL